MQEQPWGAAEVRGGSVLFAATACIPSKELERAAEMQSGVRD